MQNIIITLCGQCGENINGIIKSVLDTLPSESKAIGWADVVVVFLICLTIVAIAFISKSIIVKKKSLVDLNNDNKKLREDLSKEKSKNDEVMATYRSKALEFIEKEMCSCQKIYDKYNKGRKDEISSLEQIKESIAGLKRMSYYNNGDIGKKLDNIEKSLSKLTESIPNLDNNLSDSIKSISELMGKGDVYFKQSPYLKVLNDFIKGNKNIDSVLSNDHS